MFNTDPESSNLQQFESCLSLTNLVSCGMEEQLRFSSNNGVNVLYLLVCSDHPMVRRAAVECLCNMPLKEQVDIYIYIYLYIYACICMHIYKDIIKQKRYFLNRKKYNESIYIRIYI
jgi:hypothetical protein